MTRALDSRLVNPEIISASVASRYIAWLIDLFVFLLLMISGALVVQRGWDLGSFLLATSYVELAALASMSAFAIVTFTAYFWQSPGMALMDLQILPASDNEQRSVGRIFRRLLGLPVTILSPITALATYQHLTIGDLLSGTRVVWSVGIGKRLSYDAGRIFRTVFLRWGLIILALSFVYSLLTKGEAKNSDLVVNAVLSALLVSTSAALFISGLVSRLTRVRLSNQGVQPSGVFAWKKTVEWSRIDYAQVVERPLLSAVKLYLFGKRRSIRIPLEPGHIQFVADSLSNKQIRIER